jgi:hypothetical protein
MALSAIHCAVAETRSLVLATSGLLKLKCGVCSDFDLMRCRSSYCVCVRVLCPAVYVFLLYFLSLARSLVCLPSPCQRVFLRNNAQNQHYLPFKLMLSSDRPLVPLPLSCRHSSSVVACLLFSALVSAQAAPELHKVTCR